jgi:hypothetical protein
VLPSEAVATHGSCIAKRTSSSFMPKLTMLAPPLRSISITISSGSFPSDCAICATLLPTQFGLSR